MVKKKLVPGLYQDYDMLDIEYDVCEEISANNEFLDPADSRDYRNRSSTEEQLLQPEERVLVDRV